MQDTTVNAKESRGHMPDLTALFAQGTHVLMLPAWLELAAVVVGSFSGSLVAIERELDLTGCIALSLICGLGGGLIRDVIMQEGDVYMLSSTPAILLCIAAGAIVFHFPTLLKRMPDAIEWADIISVGLFCAAGVNKALMYGLGGVPATLMGIITGVGGGMLRDVFLGDVPRIFQATTNYYAICAAGGSLAYLVLYRYAHVMNPWVAIVCTIVTVALRRASLHFGLVSSPSHDYTDEVLAPVRRARAKAHEHSHKNAS